MRPRIYETARITPGSRLELHEDSFIGDLVFINVKRLLLGRGSQINAGAVVAGGGELIVGEYSVIGYNAVVLTGTDTLAPMMADAAPPEKRRVVRGVVEIGSNVFIGSGSVITVSEGREYIRIGGDSVIGALSYVDRDVPPRSVGWGAPWRKIKERETG